MSSEAEASETSHNTAEGCSNSALRMLFLLFVGVIGVFLLWPSGGHPRSIGRATQCRNNLKQIAMALHNYHDAHKCFPPAYVVDDNGRPLHSWRVLILSYFVDHPDLCEQYRFDEPWDGPNNSQLANQVPDVLRCPSEPNLNTGDTNYLLIIGDGSAWADGRAPTTADFTDGTSNTIMLVEVANSGIHWMEPRDLTFEQAMRGINSPLGVCISAWHPVRHTPERQESANVAFADGSTVNLKNDFPLDELRKLLTHQGREKVKFP